MLSYRALLIDTTKDYRRPVQQYFTSLDQALNFAKAVLLGAGEKAQVVFYRSSEIELGYVAKEDVKGPDDKISVQNIRQAEKKAG